LFKKCSQAVELRVPELLVAVKPFKCALQRFALESAADDAAGLLPLDQAGAFQDSEVLHEPRQRHREWVGEFADRALAVPQPGEDRTPGGVCQRAEDCAQRIVRIVNHWV
jgi:hypothetical protein